MKSPMEQFTISPILRGNRPLLPVHVGHADAAGTLAFSGKPFKLAAPGDFKYTVCQGVPR